MLDTEIGYGFTLAQLLLVIGTGAIISLAVKIKNPLISPIPTLVIGLLFLVVGIAGGGIQDFYDMAFDSDDGDDIVTDGNYIIEGITLEVPLKNLEDSTAIASKTVGLFKQGTTLIDIQSAKATPLQTVTTDANGVASFASLSVGDYVVAYYNDETAFDGTHYAAASKTVTVRKISVLESDETISAPALYVKKLGDAYYSIEATNGTNTGSGIDADATITEQAANGTIIDVKISCDTDKAWLTDPNYVGRVYLYDAFDGSGTEIDLSDCKLNSASGPAIQKDTSATYYIPITTDIMRNDAKAENLVISFRIWVPDMDNATDTYEIEFKFTLIRNDSTNTEILQDAGHKITITAA